MKELTTFRIGGKARFFCIIKEKDEIKEALKFANKNNLDFFILGGGSNILVSDHGFDGLVVKIDIKGIEFNEKDGNLYVKVGAGENWDDLVKILVHKEYCGLENLSYIPGTVGASPVQNIGAYGSEVKDFIHSVEVFDSKNSNFTTLNKNDCDFSYRSSLFKREKCRYIITHVNFLFSKKAKINLDYKDLRDYFSGTDISSLRPLDVRNAVIEIRKNKLPDIKDLGTAGSFFKNPIITEDKVKELTSKWKDIPIYPYKQGLFKVSLAWIIDKVCNYKGIKKGDVGTYNNQSLVIINSGNATSDEVNKFALEIENIVKEKTGISVEREVEWVGKL